jgi:hypothetical protein
VEIFLCLWATFKFHQQITIHSSKNFLENVWDNFRKCEIFTWKRGAQNNIFFILEEWELGTKNLSKHNYIQLMSAAAELSCEMYLQVVHKIAKNDY